MAVTVAPATLRDATYIVANMRDMDRREVMCQVGVGTTDMQIAYFLLMNGEAYAVRWTDRDGREHPVVFFGVQPMNAVALSIWALGTKHAWRGIPAVTRFVIEELVPRKMREGFRIMEARSIDGHAQAHRWMESTGAHRIGEPFEYGRDGELFHLFRWTTADYAPYLPDQRYRDTSTETEGTRP